MPNTIYDTLISGPTPALTNVSRSNLKKKMNVEFSYTKKRLFFGKPYVFRSRAVNLVCNLAADRSLEQNYVYERFIDKGIQNEPAFSANDIVMATTSLETRGMFHSEGGWPREINQKDEDQIERYRKRVQRDDSYVYVMEELTKRMENEVLQNTTVGMNTTSLENPECQGQPMEDTLAMTHEYQSVRASRVRQISWMPLSCDTFVATMDGTESFIWNLANPSKPTSITASCSMTDLKYLANDDRLVGGLDNGKLAIWNVRNGGEPLMKSAPELSHRDAIVALIWTSNKSEKEVFTAGADGMIKWWGCTNLRKPKSELFIGEPLTCLEYDPNIPAKFLIGTASGYVICGSRRTDGEALPWRMKVSDGAVVELARNPAFPKILLTASGKTVKIWSEDCRYAPLFWTAATPADILTAQWSPTRCSVIACGRLDNFIDIWDFCERRSAPLYSIRIGSTAAVTALAFQDEGKSLAVGSENGSISIYRLPKKLTIISTDEKTQLSTVIDRESNREKLIEAKLREIQLKQKETKVKQDKETASIGTIDSKEHSSWLNQIKNDYRIAVNQVNAEISAENDQGI